MKNKIFAILTCVCLVATFLGGCGKSDKTSSGTKKTASASLDFKGEEIILAYPWKIASADSSPTAQKHYDLIQKLNKKFNVKITEKSISGAYYNTNMVTTVLSKKPMGHIMIAYDQYAADYFKAGIFANLNNAMKSTGIDFKNKDLYNQNVTKFCNFNGNQVGFCNSVEVQKDLWFVNLRMLKENSIDIYDIIDKGQWTWDKAEELGKRLTKDTNNDGTPDIYGIGSSSAMGFAESLANSNNSSLTKLNDSKTPVLSWEDTNALEAINRLYKWCTVDNICKPCLSNQAWTQAATDFVNGSYAMIQGPIDYLTSFQSAGMKDKFGVIPPPKGPQNTSKWYSSCGNIAFFQFIPVTYESRASELIQLYQELCSNIDGKTKSEAWEDQYMDLVCDDQSMDYLMKLGFDGYQKLSLTTALANSWGDPSLSKVFENITKNITSPGAAIQQYDSQFQAQIKDRWDGVSLTGLQ